MDMKEMQMSAAEGERRVVCEGCDNVVQDGRRFCATCDADLCAHIDALAAEEKARALASEIFTDEQLRKNHRI